MISDSNNSDPTGPSFESLSRLHKLLPSLAQDVASGNMKGKGKPALRTRPRKMCKVCCKQFDLVALPEDAAIQPGICERCEGMLKGNVALVSGDKFAFVKSSQLKDLIGQIVHMHPDKFAQVEKAFGAVAEQRKKNDS